MLPLFIGSISPFVRVFLDISTKLVIPVVASSFAGRSVLVTCQENSPLRAAIERPVVAVKVVQAAMGLWINGTTAGPGSSTQTVGVEFTICEARTSTADDLVYVFALTGERN